MTDEEKAEENAKTYRIDLCAYCRECEKGSCSHTDDAIFGFKDGYKRGLAEGRKNCMTLQNAMETIKRYCKEITDENNNCSKCIFCSKGFNGCKLQSAPCEWE